MVFRVLDVDIHLWETLFSHVSSMLISIYQRLVRLCLITSDCTWNRSD